MDRISNLPENLIALILEKLSVRNRVTTSSLSRKWRLRWTFLSSLNLDAKFYHSIRRISEASKLEYVAIINCLVLQQRGHLKEFSLYMDLQPMNPLIQESYQHLISYVMRSNNIVRLCLRNYVHAIFPFPTFSSKNLTHLEIGGLRLTASFRFEGLGFPNLTHLLLDNVRCGGVYISDFVSICPQLEEVRLVHVYGGDIEMNAPKLTRLEIVGNIRHVSISNVEKLESLSMKEIYPFGEEETRSTNIFNLFNNSTQLQHITLDGSFCKYLGSYGGIQMLARFDQLKSLKFHDMSLDDPDVFLFMLSLCRCSPNVTELQLKSSYPRDEAADPLELATMAENYNKNDFGHIVKIDLFGLRGTQVEGKITEVLLRFSPLLEVMNIDFHDDVAEKAKLQFLKPFLNLYRASNKAKIHFT